MSRTYQDIGAQLQHEINRITTKLGQQVYKSIGKTLEEFRDEMEQKLSEFIERDFYEVREPVPYYRRTGQLRRAGKIVIKQGGGHYTVTAYIDVSCLKATPPPAAGMLGSYCSLGKGMTVSALSDFDKMQLVDEWEEQYGFLKDFNEWFEKTMVPKLQMSIRSKIGTYGVLEEE